MAGRPREDQLLIDRARGGDTAAYGDLVRRHQQIAFRLALVITGSAADAEEAAQDGFVKAWRALSRFRTGEPFRPWLLAIVANEARSRRRSSARRAALVDAVAAGLPVVVPEDDPSALAVKAERRAGLLAAVNRLAPDHREVVGLRYFLDLGEAEMAAALGCRAGTVKSRLSRALARLAEEVDA